MCNKLGAKEKDSSIFFFIKEKGNEMEDRAVVVQQEEKCIKILLTRSDGISTLYSFSITILAS